MWVRLRDFRPAAQEQRFLCAPEERPRYLQGFFKSDLPGFGYDFYDPPIPIEVEGSLFFDASHARGTPPGPAKLRPHMPRIWEVHPISKIVLEP